MQNPASTNQVSPTKKKNLSLTLGRKELDYYLTIFPGEGGWKYNTYDIDLLHI